MENFSGHRLRVTTVDILVRALKYFIEGGAVAFAAYVIPQRKLNVKEILTIAITAAAIFAILDLFAPAVGTASRQGAGLGIGAGLVGFQGINLGQGLAIPGVPALA